MSDGIDTSGGESHFDEERTISGLLSVGGSGEQNVAVTVSPVGWMSARANPWRHCLVPLGILLLFAVVVVVASR